MISQNNITIGEESIKINYIEGTSDSDAYVTGITIPEAPEGYTNVIISLVYLDPNLNMWVPCVSYRAVGNSYHVITGGPSYGVAAVVGGVDCYRCGNATWRCYYYTTKNI